jgi:glycosyltransferase involved in cell wall biosynthesis
MIRILHIVGTMDLGGVEQFIMNMYRNIDRSKIQFDFIVHKKDHNYFEDEINELGGRLYRITSKKENMLKSMIQLYNVIKMNQNYNIIHIHNNSAICVFDIIVAKFCGIRNIIVHSHSTNTGISKKTLHRNLRSIMSKLATYKFACSELAAKWFFRDMNNVTLINNAIDSKKFIYNKNYSLEFRKKLNINEDELILGHIGSFSYAKNHDFLIDIFKAVTLKRKDAKLILVGEGNLMEKIADKVEQLNLSSNVVFLGLRYDIPQILSAFDILVFPSLYEGFPVTLVEAQASGLKCIISDKITNQVKLTSLIESVSLNSSPNDWAEIIIKNANYERKNTFNEIKESGFDIESESNRLQSIYLKINEGGK